MNQLKLKKDNQDLEKKIEKAEKEKKNAVLHLEKAEYNSDEYKKYVVVLNECEKELEKLYKEWEKQK